MDQINRKQAREVLDIELKIAIQGNDTYTAWALLKYAYMIEVISKEEYEYLDKAIRCLG